MPPFALIVVFVVILIFLLSRTKRAVYFNLLIFYCFLDISFLQGVFIFGLADSNLSFARVVGIVFSFYAIYYAWATHIRIHSGIMLFGVLFLFLASIGTIYEILDPYTGEILVDGDWDSFVAGQAVMSKPILLVNDVIKAYVKLGLFVFNVFVFKTIVRDKDLIRILHVILRLSYLVVAFGFVEYIMKNVLEMPFDLYYGLDFFFGGQDSAKAVIPYIRGDSYNLVGFTRESSHFVVSLYCFSGMYLLYQKIRRTYLGKGVFILAVSRLYFPAIVALMILSGGATAILALFILGVLYIALRFNLYRMAGKSIALSLFGLLFLLYSGYLALDYVSQDPSSYFGQRVNLTMNVLETLMSGTFMMPAGIAYDSSFPRFLSIIETFRNYVDRPLVGLGMSVQIAHDTTVVLLSDVGLLGVLAWIVFVTRSAARSKYDYVFFSIYIFLMGIPSGVGNPLIQFYFVVWIEATRLYCDGIVRKKELGVWPLER